MKRIFATMIMVGLLLTAACGTVGGGAEQDARRVIAASIVPEQTFIEAVVGDDFEVLVLVPPGQSPENYEPLPADIEKLSRAELYFTIGIATEEARVLPGLSTAGGPDIIRLEEEVRAEIPELYFAPGEPDPHIWLSPRRVKLMVEVILREVSELLPEQSELYRERAAEYLMELDEVDEELRNLLAGRENNKFIVFHPAFGYLADEYGLEMYALEKDGKEPTARRIAELVEFARENEIRAVFYQAETAARQAEAFAEEIGGRTIMLDPLSADYIANLSEMARLLEEVL